ncbi:MAG: glycosyltransferase family 1 protein [Bacteroidaceae bacterium]|nr:glycosyltransferase family 1 protein [Bacteroidaceae bacterium]
MRILYYYPEVDSSMFQWQRIGFMDELSRHNVEFDIFNPLLFDNLEAANDELVKRAKAQKYDLFFTNLCNEKHLLPEALKEIKRIGLPTVTFRSDNLIIPFNDKSLARYFDVVWLTSKETSRLYKKWGATTFFAPYAANPYQYKYIPQDLVRRICFVGSLYGSRPLMVNNLSRGGYPVDVYCKKNVHSSSIVNTSVSTKYVLPKLTTSEILKGRLTFSEGHRLILGSVVSKIKKNTILDENDNVSVLPSVPFNEMIQKYSSYSLSIAYTSSETTDVLKHPLKIIDLRNFEIPMCGGVEFCRHNEELASYFKDGEEIIFYNSDEELLDKANFIINNAKDEDIIRIKRAARKKAENEHSWWNRFSLLFREMGLSVK